MKRLLKILSAIGIAVVILLAAAAAYFFSTFPKSKPAASLTISATPERIARGGYLAHHVTVCVDCHSSHDRHYFGSPVVAGTEGKGGEKYEEEIGVVYVRNLTPAGLGNWTDGEIVRAMTGGVDKDGKALAPLMPYTEYKALTPEDAYAIVAYLRTLPSIPNEVPKSQINFPFSLVMQTIPDPVELQNGPNPADSVAYGKYLVKIAGCQFCHTPAEKGEPLPGMDFAGGFEFKFPHGGVLRSANITPDYNTGIGALTRAEFIARFKEYAQPELRQIPVSDFAQQTVMPWLMYAGMTEQDLGAIYSYLRTVPPVQNSVERQPVTATLSE